MLGERLASLVPPPEQPRVHELLTAFGRSEQPAQCRTAFRFGTKVLAARLAPILEEKACTGLVVILEGEESLPVEGE